MVHHVEVKSPELLEKELKPLIQGGFISIFPNPIVVKGSITMILVRTQEKNEEVQDVKVVSGNSIEFSQKIVQCLNKGYTSFFNQFIHNGKTVAIMVKVKEQVSEEEEQEETEEIIEKEETKVVPLEN